MIDGIIKGNGTSRKIKASLPPVYASLVAIAENDGIPCDLLFNPDGWQQLPTYLSKDNLLSDETAKAFNSSFGSGTTLNDIFSFIATNLTSNPYTFQATLLTSKWTGTESAGYTCKATIMGVKESDRLVVIRPEFSSNSETRKQELLASYCINDAHVFDNSITFYAFRKKPLYNLTVNISVVRSL